jgi:hypothetical protein
MIRKTCRRRPSFESLESMVLLSGFSAVTHHAAPALMTKLPDASTASKVSGTLRGTITIETPLPFKASGVVSPFGHTTAKGSFLLSAETPSMSNPSLSGTFTLTTSKGNIVVDATDTSLGKIPLSLTVIKGTKHLSGIVGSGSGSTTWTVNPKPHGGKFGGTFSLTLHLQVTMPTK